jgi:hypothetical protein
MGASLILLFPDPELALRVEEPALGVLVADVLAVGPEVSALGVLETEVVAVSAEISLHDLSLLCFFLEV